MIISDHINHIRNVAGVDFVGIGASYDGINEYDPICLGEKSLMKCLLLGFLLACLMLVTIQNCLLLSWSQGPGL